MKGGDVFPHGARNMPTPGTGGAIASRGAHSAGCPDPLQGWEQYPPSHPPQFGRWGARLVSARSCPLDGVAGRAPLLAFSWAPGTQTRKDAHNPAFPRLAPVGARLLIFHLDIFFGVVLLVLSCIYLFLKHWAAHRAGVLSFIFTRGNRRAPPHSCY